MRYANMEGGQYTALRAPQNRHLINPLYNK